MIGAAILYRVPSSTGWRLLTGTITNITDTAIVVKEEHFGGQSTISLNWLVMYDWIKTAAAITAQANPQYQEAGA